MLTREDLIQRSTFHRLVADLPQQHEAVEGRAIVIPLKAAWIEHEAKSAAYAAMAHRIDMKGE